MLEVEILILSSCFLVGTCLGTTDAQSNLYWSLWWD